jgi:hypothetical protein
MAEINLKIGVKEATALLEYYKKKYNTLWLSIPEGLRSELNQMNEIIQSLNKQIATKSLDSSQNKIERIVEKLTIEYQALPNKYNRDASRFTNTLWVLNTTKKLVTTRQIIAKWQTEDPKILEREKISIGEMQGKLSSTLKQKVDNGIAIKRVRPDFMDEYFYGLSEWFTPNGVPLLEFIPKGMETNLFILNE